MQSQQSSSHGTAIILIVIVAVSALLFFYFKGKPTDDAFSSLEMVGQPLSSEATAASDRVVKLLNQIKALKIDSTLFQSQAFQSLVDYTVAIPEQNIGRPNPFAPVGGAQAQTQTQTPRR